MGNHLSLRTIGTRVAKIVETTSLNKREVEDLTMVSNALHDGNVDPTTLGVFVNIMENVATKRKVDDLWRPIESLTYWQRKLSDEATTAARVDPSGIPDWMVKSVELDDPAPAAPGIPDWMTEIVNRAQAEGRPVDFVVENRARRDALLAISVQAEMAKAMLDALIAGIDNILGA